MRTALALFASASLTLMAGTAVAQVSQPCCTSSSTAEEEISVSPPKQVSDFTVASTGLVANGRIFKQQQINLTTEPVAEIDLSVTHNDTGLYGYVWVAESLVGRSQDRERDLQFGKDTKFGTSTWRAEIAVFELPGKEVYRLRNRMSYPIGDTKLTGSTTVDILRGGLDSEVYDTGIAYNGDHWSVSGNLAYDTAFDATGISGDVGWKPFKDKPFKIIMTGYTGNRDSGAVVKIKIW